MEGATYRFGGFVLDPAGVLEREGAVVPIGQRGAALLKALLEAGGAVVGKDELMNRAWPGLFVEEANLSVQVAALRKALGRRENGDDWIVTVPRVGYRMPQSAVAEDEPVALPGIAVGKFENLSDDPEHAYFAAGVVEDIVAALSRFRGLAVVAAEEAPAGVRYRLRGTVGRRGERLRLTVKLIEAETGVHLWATQLEGPVDALFQFQETVAESVVGVVEPRIQRAEIERARRKRPDSLGAYDLYLRALPHFRGTTPEARAEAVRLLDLAVALDPGFATGLAHCAWAHERHDTFGVGLGPEERAATLAMAERAAELGHDDPVVCAIAGLVLLNLGDEPMRALAMLEEALQRSPNHSTVMSLCAFGNLMAGDVMRARQGYLKALAVSPEALDRYELLVGVALAELMLGEFEPALGWAGKSLAANPDWLGAHWAATSALGHLGREAEARAAVARLLARAPGMRIAHLQRLAARSPTRFAVIIDGLRKAGLPE